MARSGRNKPRTTGTRGRDPRTDKILKALGITALTMLPAGAAIRAGVLVYKGLKGARAISAARKAIQAKKAGKPALSAPKSQAALPSPRTGVSTTGGGSTKVTTPGTGVQRVIQANGKGKTMKTVQGTNRPSKRPQLSGPTRIQSQGSKTKAGTAAFQLLEDDIKKLVKDRGITRVEADPNVKKKSPSLPKRKPKRTPDTKKISPKGRPKRIDLGTVTARKVTPQKDTRKKETKKAEPTKVISAGKNTGFGAKGNQFAGGAEERRILMKYYGGTGSKAARAAKEGKQGKLKELGMESLTRELRAAKVKRLKGK
jgi:hypothetical protein